MINFTVGPVMSQSEILEIANESTPYFRTAEFSKIMFENEEIILDFLNAPPDSRCVFLTASGTGAMESCVINILNKRDKIIVINGGAFGQRFVDLCELHKLDYTQLKCVFGEPLDLAELEKFSGRGYTALLVNMHETSSGILYDMNAISEFCKKNNIMLIVDAISAFIADRIDMQKLNASAVITGSQKALAVQPGISIVALAPDALYRINDNEEKCMYLSLKEALKNMDRGQTPYTPAVTILLQINKRLRLIKGSGGIIEERNKISEMAKYFRENLAEFPLEFVVKNAKDRSNAVTGVRSINSKAADIFNTLKNEYGIWICPNGGLYKDDIFRVGHIGYLSKTDYDKLFEAFTMLNKSGMM